MSAQQRLDELHHRMAIEVKSLLGDAAMAITVISISEKPTGQMVLCDVDRHAKSDTAARLRIAANCLEPITVLHETVTVPPPIVTDSEALSTGGMVHRTSESASAPIGQDAAEKDAAAASAERGSAA